MAFTSTTTATTSWPNSSAVTSSTAPTFRPATGKTWCAAGSRTGPDGEGGNKETFVSKSGRVKIEPAAWFRHGKPPVGHTVRWKVLLLGTDTYRAPEVKDATREHATTLIQGIANGKHTLELRAEGKGAVPIEAIRVYRPPMK